MDKYTQNKNRNYVNQKYYNAQSREMIQKVNNNQNKNQRQNVNEIKVKILSKKVLKKNVGQEYIPNRNDFTKNKFYKTIDTRKTNNNNLKHTKPLANNNYNARNNNLRNNYIQNKNLEHNEIKKEKKNEGYLDDNLQDECNKKLYQRVIKRLEKTDEMPVIGTKIQGDSMKNIENEEDIRPILINNNQINDKNKNNYYFSKKNNVIKIKNDYSFGRNNTNDRLNKENRSYNNSVKINNEILSRNNNNNNYEKKVRNTDERENKENNKPTKYRNNKVENIKIETNIEIPRLNDNRNKYKNFISNNQQHIFHTENNENQKNLRYNNSYNNINNDKQDIRSHSYNNQRLSSHDKYYIYSEIYTKIIPNQKSIIKGDSIIRKISYGASLLGSNPKNRRNRNSIFVINNNQMHISKNNTSNKSNILDLSVTPKTPINQKYHNIGKNLFSLGNNSVVFPDMQRGKDVFIDEKESFSPLGKIKTKTYVRGGKFNNVQTTFIVVSKNDKNHLSVEKNNNNTLDEIKSRKPKIDSKNIFPYRTPAKTDVIHSYYSNSNTNINNNIINSRNNTSSNFYNNDKYKSPSIGKQNNDSSFPPNKANYYSTNTSQNAIKVRKAIYNNEVKNRNVYEKNNKNENKYSIKCYIRRNNQNLNDNQQDKTSSNFYQNDHVISKYNYKTENSGKNTYLSNKNNYRYNH